MRKVGLLLCTMLMVSVGVAVADVPHMVNYQGYLTDTGGNALDTTVAMTFKLYTDSTAGDLLWTETRPSVIVTDGLFNVRLGQITALGDNVFHNSQVWLGITVGNNSEMTPRSRVVSVGYSYRVGTVDGASGGTITGDVNIVGKANIGSENTNAGTYAFVAGQNNSASSMYATVGGGCDNTAGGEAYTTVGGGHNNAASANFATVGGGCDNTASGEAYTTVGGGHNNAASANFAIVGGGEQNAATGISATVGGGSYNTASGGYYATVGGGDYNTASGFAATVGGGYDNDASNYYATVGGGQYNAATGSYATVGGGQHNLASGSYSATVGGGMFNRARGQYSVVAGGGGGVLSDSNSASGDYSTIGGGRANIASGAEATIGGGEQNAAIGPYTTVGGGYDNDATSNYTTVGGGWNNGASGSYATVGGGWNNGASGSSATVAGGNNNTAGGYRATVSGGYQNVASGHSATIGGGASNIASGISATVAGGDSNTASGYYANVSGGWGNRATDNYAMIPGGIHCEAGLFAFAAGRQAKAYYQGSFVWADNTGYDFSSTTSFQFNVRASGGVRIFTNPSANIGVTLDASDNTWNSVCDSTTKTNIRLVDTRDILDEVAKLPIKRWTFKDGDPNIEHISPMAQDFWKLFRVGSDSLKISTIDPDGIALAAIQELKLRTDEIEELRAENEAMRARLDMLETLVQNLLASRGQDVYSHTTFSD